VPRQFLEILAGENRKPFTNGSGRLELAQAIASRDNPLTARVIVNRVWQWHFGQAIVRTVSDFGTRADAPSHPEMLDYLATWFMDNGWSLKKLNRLIVTSATYQQRANATPAATQIDPTNQFLSHANVQRLDFEEIRDSLLAIGGKLDLTMGGQPVKISEGGRAAKSMYGSEFSLKENANRRTIYSYIDRAALPEMFNTFDFANPDMTTGERVLTTVPQQALFMMNGPFLVAQVKNLLGRNDFPAEGSTQDKVKFFYRTAFQRVPSQQEMDLAMDFIGTNESAEEAAKSTSVPVTGKTPPKTPPTQMQPLSVWERYAQVVLMSNELLFVN
jgi:Protein of unknown function (DUF1553)